jgi:hypothetical protein
MDELRKKEILEELKEQLEAERAREQTLNTVLIAFLGTMAGTFLIYMILSGLREAVCQI